MRKVKKTTELQRMQLEERLKQVRKLTSLPQPKSWIRTLREVLGMPLNVLARRLEVSPPTVMDYEHTEESGNISVATLQKVAAALESDLKILFVPKRPLPEIIRNQALKSAARIVKRADLHMSLEDQKTSARFQEKQVKALAAELEKKLGRSLWEEDS